MTLRALDRKLVRDLWRLRWQLLAIALLIACGVSVAVMSFSAQKALADAQRQFYAQTRFADGFADAKRAPMSLRENLVRIPGVSAVDTRIIEGGLMHVHGVTRPVLARLISLPTQDGGGLNLIRLSAGRLPDPSRTDEVVALKTFLDAAGVRLGDRLTAVINGRAFTFTVVGAALSPEFVYNPAPDSFMPDDAHQAVFWAPRPTVEWAAGMTGAFNNVAFTLAPGASLPGALAAVDKVLAPYGGRAAYARKDQPSNNFLDAELKELTTSGSILPPIFLVIAASLVHMVISRLVEAEREQIGLLKAFGYTHMEAARPYLLLATAVGLAGGVGGGLLGGVLGAAIMNLYADYFRFPEMHAAFHLPAFLGAAVLSMAATLAGSLGAVRRAASLSPAVAMQPPRPISYRPGPLDRWMARASVDEATRIITRNLVRFPMRTVLVAVGLSSSLALLVGTQFLFDSFGKVVDRIYYQTQRWSEGVSFIEPRSITSTGEVTRLPSVIGGEPVRAAAARLKANGREKLTRLMGLQPDASLDQPLDAKDRRVPFKGEGLVLSSALAEQLGLRLGDMVRVEVIEGVAPTALLPVTGLADDYSGYAAYMDRRALNRLMQEGDLISGMHLVVQSDGRAAFYRAIEAIPQITTASSRDDTVASWRKAMAESFRTTIVFYIGFASAIAFGVAYNMTRIALSERSRDLATLHVLGFGHGECAYILLGELAVLALLAIPVGVVGGHALAQGLTLAYARNEMRLPTLISAESIGVALLAYLVAVAGAAALVAPRIWTLDLVAVLKTRE